jgi:hypothetical protein
MLRRPSEQGGEGGRGKCFLRGSLFLFLLPISLCLFSLSLFVCGFRVCVVLSYSVGGQLIARFAQINMAKCANMPLFFLVSVAVSIRFSVS